MQRSRTAAALSGVVRQCTQGVAICDGALIGQGKGRDKLSSLWLSGWCKGDDAIRHRGASTGVLVAMALVASEHDQLTRR